MFSSLRSAATSVPGRLLPPLLWIALSFFLSHQPTLPYPKNLNSMVVSTMGHVGVFGVLAVLFWWALGLTKMSPRWRGWTAILLTMLYGVLDEWHQSFVPGRTPDIRDIVADTFGACLAIIVVTWLARRWGERQESSA